MRSAIANFASNVGCWTMCDAMPGSLKLNVLTYLWGVYVNVIIVVASIINHDLNDNKFEISYPYWFCFFGHGQIVINILQHDKTNLINQHLYTDLNFKTQWHTTFVFWHITPLGLQQIFIHFRFHGFHVCDTDNKTVNN